MGIGKYREFHRMRLDGQHIEAANLLFALLASDIVPHRYSTHCTVSPKCEHHYRFTKLAFPFFRYKGLLLADSLVYLESDEVFILFS